MNTTAQAQDSTIECNIATLISSHSDPTKLLKQLTNSAIDNAIAELNQDITTVALKAQRVDDRVKELEDVVNNMGELLLTALRKITALEKGTNTTQGVNT